MKLTIDTYDGQGPRDSTAAVSAPLTITRRWNLPTVCTFVLTTPGVPVRNARVVVADDSGDLLFTGYIAKDPTWKYSGVASGGPLYEASVEAMSDEVLLDRHSVTQTAGTCGDTVAGAIEALTGRAGGMPISIYPQLGQITVSKFVPEPGQTWSENAGRLASEAAATFKAINGTISVSPVGSAMHAFQEGDGSLDLSGLSVSKARTLYNDVTVCGAEEPAAYVTELFRGDGTTSVFQLGRVPWSQPAGLAKPLIDLFQETTIDKGRWQLNDPGSMFSVSSKGLGVKGGTNLDGATSLASIDQMELGGELVAEVAGVQVTGGNGILCGLYSGGMLTEQCFAGFHVSQSAGTVKVAPLVLGADAGSAVTLVAGHSYTLRTRVYSREMQRTLQTYCYLEAGTLNTAGGGQVDSGANVTLEIQDVSSGANTTVTVLYDGAVAFSPGACSFVPVSSLTLCCSMQRTSVSQGSPIYASGQLAPAAKVTKRRGAVTEGGNFSLDGNGRLSFYAGSVPKAGELITVQYRTSNRSVARLANTDSIARETNGAVAGISQWTGSVLSPQPRGTADCANAATALLAVASDPDAGWIGSYTSSTLPNDVWPGDLISVDATSAGLSLQALIGEVKLEVQGTAPAIVKYTMQFADDWSLFIRRTQSVPANTWTPEQANLATAANIQGLVVSSVDASGIQVQAGCTPPANGGFEVRRKDWEFRAGNDPDLVLRSPVANFAIPREAVGEQYYVRMYDGSTPPVYSEFSSAIFSNVPLV